MPSKLFESHITEYQINRKKQVRILQFFYPLHTIFVVRIMGYPSNKINLFGCLLNTVYSTFRDTNNTVENYYNYNIVICSIRRFLLTVVKLKASKLNADGLQIVQSCCIVAKVMADMLDSFVASSVFGNNICLECSLFRAGNSGIDSVCLLLKC